jgi:two-component sensor histidine kinase
MAGRDGSDKGLLEQRQKVLAQFGDVALRAGSLDEILTEACRLVGLALGTDFAKVMELQPDKKTLLVRAGVGWRDGVVGQQTVKAEENFSAMHAILTGEPVICEDVDAESRWVIPEFLRDHGVKSMVNVAILGSGDRPPYGVLQVDSREHRTFTEADMYFLRGYANLLASSVDRLRLLPELEAAVATGERLLRELQHRVKNNLQVITSLIQIQLHKTPNAEARFELEAVGHRIEALRLVHEKLYAAGQIDRVDLGTYLGELAASLLRFQSERAAAVRLQSDFQSVIASADVALPLGLIVNEFVTNSMKYAFEGGPGVIGLTLVVEGEAARLELSDNGKGLPKERSGKGTGLLLVDGLAKQIGAAAEWDAKGGTRLVLRFALG